MGGLSISARSFLLVLAALAVAFGLAIALLVLRPPQRDPPLAVHDLAEWLRLPGEVQSAPREPAFARPPPPGAGHGTMPPPPMPRPRERPRPARLLIEQRAAPPAPLRNGDAAQATAIAAQLAQQLGAGDGEIAVTVPAATRSLWREDARSRDWLAEGFVAARRTPDGQWLTVSRPAEAFPTALHRQALVLFMLGLALLLPLAWLFARALAAPIRRFAEGARRLGQDPVAPPLPRTGPREMRQAVDAFNLMQARLNRLLHERTQMVGAIAHDLRTPLTRLAFRLEDLPSPLREKVDGDIAEMKSMIAAGLDFLRDREASQQREPLDLRLLVERVVDDHADLGYDVTVEAGGPVLLHGAPLALRRLVGNLVENALKYGQRARLRLQVMEGNAVLDVDDEGPGIPEARLEQVFEPYYRLEASRNRDTGGIGLGLANARALASDHGGEITLANRKGGGLRATVRLPLPVQG